MTFRALSLLSFMIVFSSNCWSEESAATKVLLKEDSEDRGLYKDLDQDSISDQYDHCLNSGKGYKVDVYGCELDSDQDGIYDRTDQCPDTPKGIKVNFLGCEGDEDSDSVLDSRDQCPQTPMGIKVNDKGCKLDNDSDGDGILNSIDQCPETPAGATVNKYGCIPKIKVIINVTFPPNSANIPAAQKPQLDKAASQLKQLRADEVVVITGFTDSQGPEDMNLKLSWARAQSVKNYVVENFGLPSQQIYVLGKGESLPIATNDTKEGRAKNRRIEFNVLNLKNLPTTAKPESPPEMTWIRR